MNRPAIKSLIHAENAGKSARGFIRMGDDSAALREIERAFAQLHAARKALVGDNGFI